MKQILIKNATLINEGKTIMASVLIQDERIAEVYEHLVPQEIENGITEIVDATGKWLLPGVIDDQVHFREPGLTHKGDMHSESAAAVAGGVTSYMEMPNTKPQTVGIPELNWKFERAAETSVANYSFYLGGTNENIDVLKRAAGTRACGVKLFMGSSTGNMLVDDPVTLSRIFAEVPMLIAVHCEKEEIIQANIAFYQKMYGNDVPLACHPLIRSAEACYASSSQAVGLADRYGARLHLLHLSTARELTLLEDKPLRDKKITGEVCVHHLFFDDRDYDRLGNRIKWNPAIKTAADREALMAAISTGRLDVIATDHAPHLLSEKEGSCLKAASGGPLVQYSLLAMIEKSNDGVVTMEKVVEKMCHAPADLFHIAQRGYIRKGYFADLVLVDPNKPHEVTGATILSKCGWSPFEGFTFGASVERTYVNGVLAYHNGVINAACRGRELTFTDRG